MNIEQLLKKSNLRVTKERVDIFEFIKTKHIFTYNDIQNNFKKIWRSSIFRTLNLFLELLILRKVELWWTAITYELIDEKHHHEHMKCEKCDTIISFHSDNICKKLFEEAKKMWFIIKSHNIWVLWICKKCS